MRPAPGPGALHPENGRDADHVVFVHGLDGGPDRWRDQIDRLPAEYTGHAPPLRGLDDDAPFRVAGAADGVLAHLDAVGGETAHVVGHSIGGLIALQLAATHPDRVARLVLSGSPVRIGQLRAAAQRAIVRAMPRRAFTGPYGRDRQLRVLAGLAGADLRSAAAHVRSPTLIMVGELDRPHLPASGILRRTVPASRRVIVPHAGHSLPTAHAADFAALVADFLENGDIG